MKIRSFLVTSFFFHLAAMTMITLLHTQAKPGYDGIIVDLTESFEEHKLQALQAAFSNRPEKEESPEKSSAVDDEPTAGPDDTTADMSEDQGTEGQNATIDPPSEAGYPNGPVAGLAEAARYHHLLMLHARMLSKGAGVLLRNFLVEQFEEFTPQEMKGSFAEIIVTYDANGLFTNAEVATNSPELLSMLKQFPWPSMPSPAGYSLKSRGMFLKVVMEDGSPRIFVRVF